MTVKAYPIDSKGEKIGEPTKFSDAAWDRLKDMKNLRWVKVENAKPKGDSKQKNAGIEASKNSTEPKGDSAKA